MTGDDTVRVTYAELARARGVSIGAARRLAQRHRWPKQVGNDGLSHVLVPATFLVRSEFVVGDDPHDSAFVANDIAPDVARDIPQPLGYAPDELVAALADVATDIARHVAADVATDVIATLREQVSDLRTQLSAERDRADRAEGRAQEAEERVREAENRTRETDVRVRELQEQLTAEMIEHRQMVALLLKRRSWWRWRR